MQGDGETLAADFREYLETISPGAPFRTLGDLKVAYYCGAIAMSWRITRAMARPTEAETKAALRALDAEIEEYTDWLRAQGDRPRRDSLEN